MRNKFPHLYDIRYWSKVISLLLWSLFLTSYVFLMKQVETESRYEEFLNVFVSIVFVGCWWNYISKLHDAPLEKYSHNTLWAALGVLIAAFGLSYLIYLTLDPNLELNMWEAKYLAGLIIFYLFSMFISPMLILSKK